MRGLAPTQTKRLLRLLFLRRCRVSADTDSGRWGLLCMIIQAENGVHPVSNTPDRAATPARKDWARQPLGAVAWWGLPIAFSLLADALRLPFRIRAGVCAVAFAWMATGCLLNALRCHRVHCYISGPAMLLGATLAGLTAMSVVDLGPRAFGSAVTVIMLLVLLSFVPEVVWKRYA